jgi:hypothetical protein
VPKITIKKILLLGAGIATSNDAVFQSQGEYPNNARTNPELVYRLAALQNVRDSSEAFGPFCHCRLSQFPSLLPSECGERSIGSLRVPTKQRRQNVLQQSSQLFVRTIHVQFVDETIGAPNPTHDLAGTHHTLNQPHMLDNEESARIHLFCHLALLALQFKGHYPSR